MTPQSPKGAPIGPHQGTPRPHNHANGCRGVLFSKKLVFDTDLPEKRLREPTEDRNTTKLTPIVVPGGGVIKSLFGLFADLFPIGPSLGARGRQNDPQGCQNDPQGPQNDPQGTTNEPAREILHSKTTPGSSKINVSMNQRLNKSTNQ